MDSFPFSKAGLRRYLANTGWLLAGNGIRLVLGLAVGVWVARYLGAHDFGVLSFAYSLMAVFSFLPHAALDAVLPRDLIRHPERRNEYLGTAFGVRLFGAVILLGLVWLASGVLETGSGNRGLMVTVALSQLFFPFSVIGLLFQSRTRGKSISLALISSQLVAAASRVTLILLEAPLVAFAWVVVVEYAALGAVYLLLYRRGGESIAGWRFRVDIARELLAGSWPLMVGLLATQIHNRMDQLMIGELLGAQGVGQYAAASRLTEIWVGLAVVVSASLYPAIITSRERDRGEYRERMRLLYQVLALTGVMGAVVVSLSAVPLMGWLYGEEYLPGAQVLAWQIWGGVFAFLTVGSYRWLVLEGLQLFVLYRTLAGMVINVLLNLVLIPRFGIVGAAAASLVGHVVAGYLCDLSHPATRGAFLDKSRALAGLGVAARWMGGRR